MRSFRLLGALGAGLLTYGLSTGLAFSAMLYMPINNGTTWTFETRGQSEDSNGNTASYGPVTETIYFATINYPIFDHVATIAGLEDSSTPPAGAGFYLMETANGYFVVSDGNPNNNQWFEYYNDPSPFMTTDDLVVGQSVNYNGLWSGQWVNPTGGYQAWTGAWDTTITNLGMETITTPYGTFDAIKFMDVTTSTQSPDSIHLAQSTMTGYSWMVEGLGMVMSTENWFSESDFNGDGIQDWWQREELVRYTTSISEVPIPAAAWLFGSGVLGLIGLTGRMPGTRAL